MVRAIDAIEESSRDVVESALGLLLALTRSPAGGVFISEGHDGLSLLAGRGVDPEAVRRVGEAWVAGRGILACGRRYPCAGGGLLEPVFVDAAMAALIYIERAGDCPESDVGLVKELIRSRLLPAVSANAQPEVDERERLLLLLERNEWNVARVARILGVSRLTVYRRLGRLGLSRPDGPRRLVGVSPQERTADLAR